MYVDNKELYGEIVKWKADLAINPNARMPDAIGSAILLISNGFTKHWRFARYTEDWKELMVGDAIETCCKYLSSFDTERYDNPHAYITMICARCFINRIRIEKKHDAAKYKFFIETVYDSEDEDMNKLVDIDFYNDISSKVTDFEQSEKKVAPVKKDKPLTFIEILEGEHDFDLPN